MARPRGRVPARLSSLELMCVDYYLAGLIGHAVRLPGIQTLVFSPFPPLPLRLKPEPKHASGSIDGRPAAASFKWDEKCSAGTLNYGQTNHDLTKNH